MVIFFLIAQLKPLLKYLLIGGKILIAILNQYPYLFIFMTFSTEYNHLAFLFYQLLSTN